MTERKPNNSHEAKQGFSHSRKSSLISHLAITTGLGLAYLDRYGGTNNKYITGYGFDTGMPLAAYYLSRYVISPGSKGKDFSRAATIFTLCAIAELVQKIPDDVPGTYDPKDFVAYGIGVGAAYALDHGVKRKYKQSPTSTIVFEQPKIEQRKRRKHRKRKKR